MKIIIIGAGIAGLTLGIACQRAGFEVKIYEKAHCLKSIGGGILLWPHGLRFLNWLGLSSCLRNKFIEVKGCDIAGCQGESIFKETYAELYSLLGGEILPIDRSCFQQSLLQQLSKENIIFNKTCFKVKSDDAAAQVIFTDGSTENADLIVGADGIHSAVRKNINPHALLQYTNYCWWGGIIEQNDVPELKPNEVFIAMGVGKMCVVWPTSNERFMWYLPVKMPKEKMISEGDGKAQLQALCADWNKKVDKIINAPASTQSFHLAISTVLPQSHWSDNRIVLIGDAAHALGPILGQGASQAIEDVFILMSCLKNRKTAIPERLKVYEGLRRYRYQCIAKLENQAAETMIYDDAASLESFQQQLPSLNLAALYQDLIPLVNEKACLQIASVACTPLQALAS